MTALAKDSDSRITIQKFGGSSVATPSRLKRIAQKIAQDRERWDGMVIVVSAMGNTTDQLLSLAQRIAPAPSGRELDMLLSTGENITAPLLAMALHEQGIDAISLTGLQAGITTHGPHRHARIADITPTRILSALGQQAIPVVAGFQGATKELDITTLGRGGSDTTAVALAAALKARQCEIYTDVDGVYTADPRTVPEARRLMTISYTEMLELATLGAGVMHPRAVEIGETYNIPIWVRSTFGKDDGTLITRSVVEDRQRVRGIAQETNVAKLTVYGVPDRPGLAATIFEALGEQGINVDMIVQNIARNGLMDLSFTVAESELAHARPLLEKQCSILGGKGIDSATDVAKISVVGTGMMHTPGAFATMFRALANEGINIQMISTSEIRVTCVIDEPSARQAVRALHKAYELETL